MDNEHDVVVIGAGFAGLSCAARLKSAGLTNLAIVEKGEGCGGFWRGNYDRIRLHTPFHELPDDGGIRRDYPEFLPRDDLIEYFERYAARHNLLGNIVADTEVSSIALDAGRWSIRSSKSEFRSRFLVVATASNRKPIWPKLNGLSEYGGTAIHSRQYHNATPFKGKRTLVIGSGNSAAEIALDLAEGGAREVKMLIRGPRHVLSLRGLGIAARVARFLKTGFTSKHIEESHAYTRSHPAFREKLAKKDKFLSTFSIDMSEYGIHPPDSGPATQISLHGRVAWMDQGTVKAIKQGRIKVIDAKENPLQRLSKRGAVFQNGHEDFDLVVFATGMEPGLDDLFEEPARFLEWNDEMSRLMPRTDGRSRSIVEPTLFFPGFDLSVNGGLSLGLWGFECADAILRQMASVTAAT
ncbi:flavin-containing monooxygenase [Microbulbifer sp. JMSA008]|uniref:flavin-containing monooxygenase n=1 Tax=Microbulbifer sp. JMSA008 TaxID=3243373 RepID=UPI00403A3663